VQVFWRHALNGSEVTYDDLRDGHVDSSLLPPGVTFTKSGTGNWHLFTLAGKRCLDVLKKKKR
jgi:hypothetical protein